MLKLALIGAGHRGMIYAEYAVKHGEAEIVAVAETNGDRLRHAAEVLHVPADGLYHDAHALLARGRLADGLMQRFLDLLKNRNGCADTDISRSIESHLMAIAAEQSRRTHQSIDMAAFRAALEG